MNRVNRQSEMTGVLYCTALYNLAKSLADGSCPQFLRECPEKLGWGPLDKRAVLLFAQDLIAQVEKGARIEPFKLGQDMTRALLLSLAHLRYLACSGNAVASRGLRFPNINQGEDFKACSAPMISAHFEDLLKSPHVSSSTAHFLRDQRGLELSDLDDPRLFSVGRKAA